MERDGQFLHFVLRENSLYVARLKFDWPPIIADAALANDAESIQNGPEKKNRLA